MPAIPPRWRPGISWGTLADYILIVLAAIISAFNVALFLAPHKIAPGGVSGLAIIINAFTGWRIGLIMLGFNIPLLAIGTRMLGGWRFLKRSLLFALIAGFGVDVVTPLPPTGISSDLLLNTIYAGVVGGISAGLLYRGGGAGASTGVLSRLLQRLTGIPLSQAYLYTDGGIMLIAALVFSWEAGLYALITLFIWGVVADYVLEGPGVIRTATIITDRGELVAGAIIKHLGYGVTAWRGEGKYTHQMHDVLFATINRSQVGELRHVVAAADPDAFLVIGQGHQALGHSFRPLRPRFHSPRVDIAPEELTTTDDRRPTPTTTRWCCQRSVANRRRMAIFVLATTRLRKSWLKPIALRESRPAAIIPMQPAKRDMETQYATPNKEGHRCPSLRSTRT